MVGPSPWTGGGSAYVTGQTESPDFPTTAGAFDTTCGTDGDCGLTSHAYARADAFVVKLNASGTGLGYATFLGGSDYENGTGIAVDGAGSAYVTGQTGSSDFPTTAGAFDTTYNGSGRLRGKTQRQRNGAELCHLLGR